MENNQKTEKISFYTERKSALVQASVIFMLLSAIFRLVGCWGRWNDAFFAATQIALPLACNLLFILHAAVWAYAKDIRHLVLGVCQSDFSGYPDCRDDSVKAMQVALNLGMDSRFVLHTPLMWLSKRGAWELAEELGGPALVDLILEESHTCYAGERGQRHEWGYGCGLCPACRLRAAGYAAYREARQTDSNGAPHTGPDHTEA